jgi:hypothetical protein
MYCTVYRNAKLCDCNVYSIQISHISDTQEVETMGRLELTTLAVCAERMRDLRTSKGHAAASQGWIPNPARFPIERNFSAAPSV